MYTGKQQLGLANAILIADLLDRTLTDVTFPDDDNNSVAKVSTAPRFLRRPGLQLFDLADIYATLEAGIQMGRREAERDIEQRLAEVEARAYDQGMTEGLQIEHDAWAADVEDEFGTAGQRFVERQDHLFAEAEARRTNPDHVADDNADNANFDSFEGGETIPTGSFHSDVNLDGDNDSMQPGPDSGGDTNASWFDSLFKVLTDLFGDGGTFSSTGVPYNTHIQIRVETMPAGEPEQERATA